MSGEGSRGGGYSYNRGPTFFLNRGPARSKSGPGVQYSGVIGLRYTAVSVLIVFSDPALLDSLKLRNIRVRDGFLCFHLEVQHHQFRKAGKLNKVLLTISLFVKIFSLRESFVLEIFSVDYFNYS